MAQAPHELEFVVDTPAAGPARRHDDFDVYLPEGAGPFPAVVIVPGPSPAVYPVRPRDWPLFTGYGRLLASRGVVAAVVDMPYHSPREWSPASEALPGIVESVRGLDEVDADRIAAWAFSGGGLLVGKWFADSPPWLRCLALTYPLVGPSADQLAPGRPLVLTQVGLESPELQATVDHFLSRAAETGTAVHVIDVPNGHHGFDVADHTEESRHAVRTAVDLVVEHLSGHTAPRAR
jgi:dienelactone hydrolase